MLLEPMDGHRPFLHTLLEGGACICGSEELRSVGPVSCKSKAIQTSVGERISRGKGAHTGGSQCRTEGRNRTRDRAKQKKSGLKRRWDKASGIMSRMLKVDTYPW